MFNSGEYGWVFVVRDDIIKFLTVEPKDYGFFEKNGIDVKRRRWFNTPHEKKQNLATPTDKQYALMLLKFEIEDTHGWDWMDTDER